MTFEEALTLLLAGTNETLQKNGFSAVIPDNVEKDALPLSSDGEHTYMDFTGDKGRVRFDFCGTQAVLLCGDADAQDEQLTKVSTNYFDPEEFTQRDVKSLCNEFNDTLNSKFAEKNGNKSKSTKMPAPVSRSAVKNGSQSYDGNTLANRLLALYPDLKEPYRANYETYGEFLPETFFIEHATARVIGTIRSGSRQECTKLFRILNDIYENGSNDTQGLIAVTILGEMHNDPKLCETAEQYMCEDMHDTVLLVNRYLESSKGKRMREKLQNPPAYKPKKEKKPGMFAQALAGSGGAGTPPMA